MWGLLQWGDGLFLVGGFIIKIIGSRDLSVDYVIISGYVSLENFKVFE